MSIESRKHQYGTVFDHWQIKNTLGEGSGGKSAVFQLVHTSSPGVKSALKVISLIEERGNIDALSATRRADYEAAKKVCKDNAEQEVLLMNDLQGNTNIVDYLDHTFVDWSDDTGFGCDMLIRMELLTDLRSEIQSDKEFSEADVLKVGRDVCQALILCHRKNILHRDIKPENIFKNKDGNYKLGDFGVSRIMSAAPMSMASTSIGTPEYAAPEQFSGMHDLRIDIYSLGLVLYELCNGKKLPFANSSYITQQEVQMRQMGTPIPAPTQAREQLSQVILKACSFNAAERYQTAQELFDDLDAATKGKPLVVSNKQPSYATMPAQPVVPGSYATMPAGAVNQNIGQKPTSKTTPVAEKTAPQQQSNSTPKKRSKGKMILLSILAGILAVAILVAVLFFNWYNSPEQKALRAMDAGNYDSVLSILDENPGVDENAKLIDAARNQVTNIRNDFINGSMTYEEAKDALSDLSAMHLNEIVDELDEATKYIDNLHNSGEYYNAAEEFFANGQHDEAIKNYRLVNEADDNYENAQKKLSEATDLYRNAVLTEAQEQATAENYTEAINTLSNALAVLPEDTIIQGKIAEYENEFKAYIKENALADASQLAADKNYLGAIDILNNALRSCPNDSDLLRELEECKAKYISETIAEADNLISQKNFTNAKAVIKDALELYPDDADLNAKLEQINELQPVSITTLTAVNSENWKWNEGVPSDPFGNNYSSGCNYAILTNSNYRYGYSIEYRTAEKYSSISGLLAPHTAMGEEGYCYVQIFADDVLVYTSPTVNRKTDAFTFDANISGADYIKIKVYVEWSSSIIISDVSLYARAEPNSEANDNKPNTNGDNTPKPISITTLNAINQENWNWNDGEPKDLANGNYTSACNYAILKNTNYRYGYSIEYRIDGNYEKLCGAYAPHTGMGEEGYAYIQVFADDVLIYTSQNVTKKTDADTFSLDVGGAKYIKIKVYVEWSSAIILSNVTLQ